VPQERAPPRAALRRGLRTGHCWSRPLAGQQTAHGPGSIRNPARVPGRSAPRPGPCPGQLLAPRIAQLSCRGSNNRPRDGKHQLLPALWEHGWSGESSGRASWALATQPGRREGLQLGTLCHRITAWQGLAGPSVGHPAQPPAQAGSPRAGCTAPRPGGAGISPEKETPQPPWAAWARAPAPSEGRSSSSCSAGASSASVCARCPLSCRWAPTYCRGLG